MPQKYQFHLRLKFEATHSIATVQEHAFIVVVTTAAPTGPGLPPRP